MKTYLLIGLLVGGALLAPAASAHLVILAPDPLTGECTKTEIGRSDIGPHVTAWVSPCGPGAHAGPILP